MKMNEQMLQLIQKRGAEPLKRLENGGNALEIAADVYCGNLPNKDIEIGRLMAERAAAKIVEFDKNLGAAMENPELWAADCVEKLCENKTLTERCQTLAQALENLNKINGVDGRTAANVEPGEALEAELKAQLREAIVNCNLGETMVQAVIDAGADENAVAGIAAAALDHEKLRARRLVLAMVAYTMIKNGEFEEIPLEATLDDVTLGVCAAVETANAMAQNNVGVATKIVRVVGWVLGVMTAVIITDIAATGMTIIVGTIVAKLFHGLILSKFMLFMIYLLMGMYIFDYTQPMITDVKEGAVSGVDAVRKLTGKLIDFARALLNKLRESRTPATARTETANAGQQTAEVETETVLQHQTVRA